MKKLLFAAYSLEVGGIEKALVILANELQKKGYDITIILEKKQGIFLEELNKEIHVLEYKPDESQNFIQRKLKNLIKRVKFWLKYRNSFDFSACFATYSLPASFISRVASKNCCLWGHADYFTLFEQDKNKMKEFFEKRKYQKFKHVIFVSEEGKESFIKLFPEMKKKTMVCNNLIDSDKIRKMAKEEIEYKKSPNKITFLNVGRHDEKQKKLKRIIEASKKLKQDGYEFQVLLVGDGPDSQFYKEKVEQERLEDTIKFLGKKKNPYPYYKIADCVLLTSDYEGYPVVFLESFILKVPIITTKVSDFKEVEGKYGMIAEKNTQDVYKKMKTFIEKGFSIQEEFNSEKYNQEIMKKLEEIF